MADNRWWYKAKGRLERGLDDLVVGILVVLIWMVIIGVFCGGADRSLCADTAAVGVIVMKGF